MMTLPRYYYRRAWLRSFWIVVSGFLGAMVALSFWLAESPQWGVAGTVAAAIIALPVLLRPGLASLPFRAWRYAGRSFSAIAASYIAALCYYIVILPVGRLGSSLQLMNPGETLWLELRPEESKPSPRSPIGDHARVSATRGYLDWAFSGRLWAVALAPFLLILSVFEVDQADDVPTDTYTLY